MTEAGNSRFEKDLTLSNVISYDDKDAALLQLGHEESPVRRLARVYSFRVQCWPEGI
jgi:hypothetical protein